MASSVVISKDEIELLWDKLLDATVHNIVVGGFVPPGNHASGAAPGNCNVSQQGGHTDDQVWQGKDDLASTVLEKLDWVIKVKRQGNWTYLTPRQWLDWYAQLFTVLIGVATLGAGFTFTVIFSDPPQPWRHTKQYVRGCIAASWMLFVVTLGWCCLAALAVAVNRTVLLEQLQLENVQRGSWLFWVIASVLVAELLPIGAFLASAEAVRQYQNGIGIASLCSLGLGGLVVVGAWAGQNFAWVRRKFRIEKNKEKQGRDDVEPE